MEYISAQELKRRGISAVDKVLENGPVYVVKNNQPRYVALSTEACNELLAWPRRVGLPTGPRSRPARYRQSRRDLSM